MKKLILSSIAAIGLFGMAACSDSTDNTTTQSTTPAPAQQTEPSGGMATPETSTTPNVTPAPSTGTGGDMPVDNSGGATTTQPAPAE